MTEPKQEQPVDVIKLQRVYQQATFTDAPESFATAFVCSKPECTDGEHIWDGPTVQVGRAYSVSCSKCGITAFEVDTFMGGF